MIIAIIYLKNISQKTKTTTLGLAGGVFLILLLSVVYYNYFADRLVAYVPKEALFYSHFNNYVNKNASHLDSLIEKILADFEMDFVADKIDREVALVGLDNGDTIQYYLLLKVNNATSLKQEFIYNNYKILNKDTVVVSAGGNNLSLFEKNKEFKKKVKGKFFWFNSISIYFDKAYFDYGGNLLEKIIYESKKKDDNNIYINVKAEKDKLIFYDYDLLKHKILSSDKFEIKPFDIYIEIKDINNIYHKWLGTKKIINEQNVFEDFFNLLDFNELENTRIVFIAKKSPVSRRNIFSSYDFCLVALNNDKDIKQTIIKASKNILAEKYPETYRYYLNEGTLVEEMRVSPDKILSSEKDGIIGLYSQQNENDLLYINSIDNGYVVTNDNNMKILCLEEVIDKDYLQLTSELLPGYGFWNYLKIYDFVLLKDDSVIFGMAQ